MARMKQAPAPRSVETGEKKSKAQETKEKMDLVLQKSPRQITLVTDGWTNLRGELIVNYVAVT